MADAVRVRTLKATDREVWLELRSRLWGHHPAEELAREVDTYLRGDGFETAAHGALPSTVLLAERGSPTRVVGFAEVDLRPLADGCRTQPVGYLEGWYVVPEERRQGVGKALFQAAEQWARDHGCTEMASDTRADNAEGLAAHRALGYEETHRLIHFRKSLR